MTTDRRPRPSLIAVAFALLVLIAGCSAGGSDDAAAPASDDTTTTTGRAADDTSTTEPSDDEETTTTADGSSGTSKQDYVDAVTDAMREVEDEDFPIDDEQAGCLAPAWVDAIGYETLIDAGVTPEVLGGAENGDTTASFEDVVDRAMAERLVAAFGKCGIDLEQFFFDSMASGDSMTPKQLACLRKGLPDGYVEDLMATSMDGGDDALDGDPALEETLTNAALACLGEG